MKTIIHLFPAALAFLGLSLAEPKALAVVPPPDGGYPGFTTAEGTNALKNLTTGVGDTAVGWYSLFSNTDGSFNTGVGAATLLFNVGNQSTGDGLHNTAIGTAALLFNVTGSGNTAVGTAALVNNDGPANTALGAFALSSNTIGERNTAVGWQALANGTGFTNFSNTAIGYSSLFNNTSGQLNTAIGGAALFNNIDGEFNTAIGVAALNDNTSGSSNIAIGRGAGQDLTTGDRNIDIGNVGVAGESNKIRIGTQGTQDGTFIAGITGVVVAGSAVMVNGSGQLGVAASAERFKDEIKPMDTASEAIHALKPVTFRYKEELDPDGIPQFGLVAEEVEKVHPDLVARDEQGITYTVRYDAVNAMLLNEFLKEHKKVEKLEATVADLAAKVNEQAAEMRRVATQVQLKQSATQVVVSNR